MPAIARSNAAGVRSAAARLKDDADHLQAAREGIGADGTLLIDAGQIFGEDVDAAAARLPYLEGVQRDLVRGAVQRQRL